MVCFHRRGEEKKVIAKIGELEKSTGLKLRVLCQRLHQSVIIYHEHVYFLIVYIHSCFESYLNTPGLAIKDYWGVDDNVRSDKFLIEIFRSSIANVYLHSFYRLSLWSLTKVKVLTGKHSEMQIVLL